MSQDKFVIRYQSMPDVERSSSKTMAAYLEGEEKAWFQLAGNVADADAAHQIHSYNRSFSPETLKTAFGILKAALNDPGAFSRINGTSIRRQTVVPPPSDSVEGRLIIGLDATGRTPDAIAAFMSFVSNELGTTGRDRAPQENTREQIRRGDLLMTAAFAADALPAGTALSAQHRSIRQEGKAALRALDKAVTEAEAVNIEHASRMTASLKHWVGRARKLAWILLRAERNRSQVHRHWLDGIEADVANRFSEAEMRLAALDRLAEGRTKKREEEFEALKNLFHTQLRLRAPVALWEQRANTHRDQARAAMRIFWAVTAVALLFGILVPFLAGSYIAESFTTIKCLPGRPQSCNFAFSAKGPLTVAGILLATSLILWTAKMQYRIFLSERHLSLDADERKAFAETYMALKEDGAVDVVNETIVLTSLFRPTEDGLIKDDDGSMDLSAAAVLAKQLAK